MLRTILNINLGIDLMPTAKSHEPATARPLGDLPRRARGVVIQHETDPATAERLSALGLAVGASFTVVQAGPRPTVQVGESRIGLGPELACAVRALLR